MVVFGNILGILGLASMRLNSEGVVVDYGM